MRQTDALSTWGGRERVLFSLIVLYCYYKKQKISKSLNVINEHNSTLTQVPKSTRASSRHVAEDKRRGIPLSRAGGNSTSGAYLRISHTP